MMDRFQLTRRVTVPAKLRYRLLDQLIAVAAVRVMTDGAIASGWLMQRANRHELFEIIMALITELFAGLIQKTFISGGMRGMAGQTIPFGQGLMLKFPLSDIRLFRVAGKTQLPSVLHQEFLLRGGMRVMAGSTRPFTHRAMNHGSLHHRLKIIVTLEAKLLARGHQGDLTRCAAIGMT